MEYIVIIYTEPKESTKSTSYRVNEKDMWDWLDRAKEENLKIAIHKLGECVLDWS